MTSSEIRTSRLEEVLGATRAQSRAALAVYLPAGYPTLDQSLDTFRLLATYADVIEVGLPFSDPMMDGPSIQHANAQALQAGFRIEDVFTTIRELAAISTAALLVMTYWQPVHRYGPERFARRLAAAGGAAAIIPDLPVEEATDWLRAAHEHGLNTVFVVAPNVTDQRLARLCGAGSGMIYAPATAGVTGTQGPLHPGLNTFVDRLRGITPLPIGVGIGVSTPEQAAVAGSFADAVIVGSAFIRTIEANPGPTGAIEAATLARNLARGLRSPLQSAA
ncbi:tryptophan synthase subunit alpha [Actinacidiphila sp. ITFR-21]|uniref:tryptophan synthase subunit alpha n=1 Tax=Actinacidiphila sp. ITFR-21 TaxID=3075199 RepID=UPI00288A658F|nr:tryptophan synthase subunit alpha [Streptomyces sp. ITFR-21]WNI20092.1 tryptophan synthase subunit alpha [Streptomyces sp. ITFR-21]